MSHFLFIHGTFGRASDWHEVRTILEEKGPHSTDAFTLSGHEGIPLETDKSLLSVYTKQLVSHLKQPTIIVGYSLGGRIALQWAAMATNTLQHTLIQGLVLESANPGISDAAQRTARAEIDRQRARDIRLLGLYGFLHQWYQAPLFGALARDADAREQWVRDRIRNHHEEALANVIEQASPGIWPDRWDQLATLPSPLLFIYGQEDLKYQAIGQRIQQLRPSAQCEKIANAGHNTHRVAPARFADLLHRFSSEIDAHAHL